MPADVGGNGQGSNVLQHDWGNAADHGFTARQRAGAMGCRCAKCLLSWYVFEKQGPDSTSENGKTERVRIPTVNW